MEKIEETETFNEKKFQRDIFPPWTEKFFANTRTKLYSIFFNKIFLEKVFKKNWRDRKTLMSKNLKKKILHLKSKQNCNKNFCI